MVKLALSEQLVEKVAKPVTLEPEGWYVKLNRYIGWSFDTRNFCPFFWRTVLGVVLVPFVFLFKQFIAGAKKVLNGIGYVIGGMYKAACYMIPHKLLNTISRKVSKLNTAIEKRNRLNSLKKLQAKYGHNEEFAYYAAYRAGEEKLNLLSEERELINKMAEPAVKAIASSKFSRAYIYKTDKGKIYETTNLEKQYNTINDMIRKDNALHQAKIGIVMAVLGFVLIAYKISIRFGAETIGNSLVFIACGFAIAAVVLAVVVGSIVGGPLLWGYFKHVVLQKYCPAIEWKQPEPELESEETSAEPKQSSEEQAAGIEL